VLRTKDEADEGFGLRGFSTPLSFMLAWFSFGSGTHHSGLSRLVGVELGVVSSMA
jgi:hypothetical protein